MLSRFHLIPERNGQTDRRTDRFAISIRASVCWRAIKTTNTAVAFELVLAKRYYVAFGLWHEPSVYRLCLSFVTLLHHRQRLELFGIFASPNSAATRTVRIIKPPLATVRAASCNGRVHLFVCLFVCLSVCLSACRQIAKNAIFSKTKQFRAIVSIDYL